MNKIAVLAVIALLVGTAGAVGADGPTTFTIQAGAAATEASFEHTRFYPHDLQVHQGDSVTWRIERPSPNLGFHTVTFLPEGEERPPLLRADEIAGNYNVPERWFASSGCGQTGAAACVIDDVESYHSSGVPPINADPDTFTATLNLPAGSYQYLCTVHASMTGTVSVVDDEVDVATQEQLDAQIAADVEADRLAGLSLLDQDPGFVIEDGRRVYTVLLGDSTPNNHVAVNQFIPASLSVASGDGVQFVFDDEVVDEIHTVSFPEVVAGSFSPFPHGKGGFGFYFKCDPDDPLTGATGVPCLPDMANELGVAPWMSAPERAPGDALLTPVTVHDSAILAPAGNGTYGEFPDGTRLPDSFAAEFPVAGTFPYICQVHMQPMTGSITVA
jgi:plastocyanin